MTASTPPSADHDPLSDLPERARAVAGEIRDRLAATWDETEIAAAEARLDERDCLVVVCGEFKRGKSSLINALIGRPGVLPVNEDIATSIVTRVHWAESDGATVRVGDEAVRIDLGDLARYVTEPGNPENERDVRGADVGLPAPLLRDGIVLADTPGVGGDPAHLIATLALLDSADVVLFVADATEPLTVAELDFLDLVAPLTGAVAVAVTKIDKVADPAVPVADTHAKVAERLNRPGSVPVFPVSSAKRLDALAEQDPALDASSGFAALEAAVRDDLAARVRAGHIVTYALALAAALQRAAVLGEAEEKTLRNRADRADGEARLTAAERRAEQLGALRAPGAAWRTTVDERLAAVVKKARRTMESSIEELRDELTVSLLADEALLADPDELGRRLVAGVVQRVGAVGRVLQADVDRLLAGVATDLDLELLDHPVGTPEFVELDRRGIDVPHIKRTIWQKGALAVDAAKDHALKGAAVGSFLGAIIGFGVGLPLTGPGAPAAGMAGAVAGQMIGGAIGTVFASVAGWRRKLRKVRRKETAERRRELQDLLLAYLAATERRASRAVVDAAAELRHAVPEQIAEQVAVAARTAATTAERLRAALALTTEQAEARLAELAKELAWNRDRQAELEAIVEAAAAVTAADRG